jgi:putative hydrolase of the HAD superfamily
MRCTNTNKATILWLACACRHSFSIASCKQLMMGKKAYIFDLDNTLYSVPEYGDRMFKKLFSIIEESGDYKGDLQQIKDELMRVPLQKVAENFSFGEELKEQALEHLRQLTYDESITPFSNYELIKQLPGDRFIVTMGFEKFQWSKIKAMKIEPDFKEIFVVDPETTDKIKRDVFEEIMRKHGYTTSDVYIIGDDPESEVLAAQELGAHAILFDADDRHEAKDGVTKVDGFAALLDVVK